MTDNKHSLPDRQKDDSAFDFGNAIAVGVSLGLIFGLLIDNIGIGLSTGLAVATVANAWHEKRQGEPGAATALVISIGALLIVIAIWIASALGWP